MNIVSVSCKSCGAPISIPPGLDTFNCSHCGASLLVQRGEGYVSLKLAEDIKQSIENMSDQTNSTLREGAKITQQELVKLQIQQEINSLNIQISNIQSEIRMLERSKITGKVRSQLRTLRSQQSEIQEQVWKLKSKYEYATPNPFPGVVSKNTSKNNSEPFLKTKFGKSLGSGCLTFFIISAILGSIANILNQLILGLPIDAGSTLEGPVLDVVAFITTAGSIIAFIYYYRNGKSIFTWIKEKFTKKNIDPISSPEKNNSNNQSD